MFQFGGGNGMCTCGYPFVLDINDDMDNRLIITVSLPVRGDKGENVIETGNEKIKEIIENACPIYPSQDMIYEIIFDDYIAYQVRNESFCSKDDYEIMKGKYFVVFERSRYLDQIQTITNCSQFEDGSYYPGKWVHYGVYANNHIIDVISHHEPLIKKRSGCESCRESYRRSCCDGDSIHCQRG